MGEKTEQYLVTIPEVWDIKEYASSRKFHNVQDFIREIIRREIEESPT